MCGLSHFCVLWIVCEIFKPLRKILHTIVRISIVIPLLFWFWVLGFVSLQFPGAGSSRRSATGLDDDKSCDVDVEDELVRELDDNPGNNKR